MTTPQSPQRSKMQWIGLAAGPALAAILAWLLPASYRDASGALVELSDAGRATLAVMAWMAVWWLTEAIDIPATALIPVALFPLLGIADVKSAAAPYASDIVFLFLGGFLLALAMQRWGLDRRIALITLRWIGTRPSHMVGGFMGVTAVLSAFVSNTATTAMMLPIALSVIALVRPREEAGGVPSPSMPTEEGRNFSLCLLLGIAYAASIGGIATLIGTPPNAILAQFIQDQMPDPYRAEVSFAGWLVVGGPIALIFLPIVWWLLTRRIYPIRVRDIEGGQELIGAQLQQLGKTHRAERTTFLVFCCTALAWITRPLWADLTFGAGAEALRPFAGLSDAGIVMIASLILFVLPAERGGRGVLDWQTARRLPWGILILFGGGLSLASAVKANGVAELIGSQVTALRGAPQLALVLAVVALVIFLTELTSNTATTATLLPILTGVALGLELHPFLLIVPATLAASCAFMMPVATPPNAIVFGSGHVSLPQMCRAGLWLNLIGIALVTMLTYAVVLPLLVG
ncbi:MAG: SLC13 family permease [Acidobacteriota bacterium]